ncbi:MAG: transcription termination factor NusA [Patescibacteria group bacterium]
MAKDNEIMQAAKQICEEKKISLESVIQTIEAALAVAYRKDFGEKNQNVKVEFNMVDGSSRVFDVKTVVPDEKVEQAEKLKEERKAREEAGEPEPAEPLKHFSADATAEDAEDPEKEDRFNPKTEIGLSEAKKLKKGSKLDDVIKTELFPPAAYGRMAAQTAKQVIVQRLREAEREMIFREFKGKEGDVINGSVQRVEGRLVLVDLGVTTAILPVPEQTPRERYTPGQRYKFYLVSVNSTSKGPEIVLSRSHPELVRKLFALEVPEVGSGAVEIRSMAREAGSRTKVAVVSNQKNIDPVGSCVGQRGSRVQTIISEIGGEKIDIVEFDEDTARLITNSLSPAKVINVTLNEAEHTATVMVKEDQLSLAIGKAGQNVRLSAKLTGWKIDIVSDQGDRAAATPAVPTGGGTPPATPAGDAAATPAEVVTEPAAVQPPAEISAEPAATQPAADAVEPTPAEPAVGAPEPPADSAEAPTKE